MKFYRKGDNGTKVSFSNDEIEATAEKILKEWLARHGSFAQIEPENVADHRRILSELHAQYVAKNADYGDSISKTFEEFGMTAPLIRMKDKLNRITVLVKQENQVKNETLRDTLLDLANYAITAVMELDAREPS